MTPDNANRVLPIAYPKGLINDVVPPSVSAVTAVFSSPSTVRITWNSDEYTKSVVKYGFSSGSYPLILSDLIFNLTHDIQLTGAPVGATVFYRIVSTDRSGNISQSQEFIVANLSFIYLPLVRR